MLGIQHKRHEVNCKKYYDTLFSAQNRQKNNNIQPCPENIILIYKKEKSVVKVATCLTQTVNQIPLLRRKFARLSSKGHPI